MASNKHAIIRYRTLDRCFKDQSNDYTLKDLIRECTDDVHAYQEHLKNKRLEKKSISKRTILYDIKFMRDEEHGFGARIEHDRKEGYFYTDPRFEIFKARIAKPDLDEFADALEIMKRISGKGQFKELESAVGRIEASFNIKRSKNSRPTLLYESSTNIEGQKWISRVKEAIRSKTALSMEYEPFDKPKYSRVVSPYYVKEYNGRWFLIGFDHDKAMMTNVGMERIKALKPSLRGFKLDSDNRSDNYLEDIVGVSLPIGSEKQLIKFKALGVLRHYIKTKPTHESQELLEMTIDYAIYSITVHVNYELTSKLLQHKANLVVLSPESLREEMKGMVGRMMELYR